MHCMYLCMCVFLCVCVCVSLLSLGSSARETLFTPAKVLGSRPTASPFLGDAGAQCKDWALLGSRAGIWVGICLCRKEPFLRGKARLSSRDSWTWGGLRTNVLAFCSLFPYLLRL